MSLKSITFTKYKHMYWWQLIEFNVLNQCAYNHYGSTYVETTWKIEWWYHELFAFIEPMKQLNTGDQLTNVWFSYCWCYCKLDLTLSWNTAYWILFRALGRVSSQMTSKFMPHYIQTFKLCTVLCVVYLKQCVTFYPFYHPHTSFDDFKDVIGRLAMSYVQLAMSYVQLTMSYVRLAMFDVRLTMSYVRHTVFLIGSWH